MMRETTAKTLIERRSYYVGGEPVELWENADSPFGWTAADLETYATSEQWELLFNALVLSSILEASLKS